jgi:hypothetical protein
MAAAVVAALLYARKSGEKLGRQAADLAARNTTIRVLEAESEARHHVLSADAAERQRLRDKWTLPGP